MYIFFNGMATSVNDPYCHTLAIHFALPIADEVDVGALNGLAGRFLPAGFYYKTFMWTASAWKTYEHFIRRAAGLGVAPTGRDPDRYDKTFAHCDLLVVGAGPAGQIGRAHV